MLIGHFLGGLSLLSNSKIIFKSKILMFNSVIMLCFESIASSIWSIHWFYASHQHAFFPDCVHAASPMTLSPTAMRPSTLQHLLSSRRPRCLQPPSPFYLCRQGSRPKRKSSPAGWPYSSACWLLVGSCWIAKYLSDSVLCSVVACQSAKKNLCTLFSERSFVRCHSERT